MRKHLKAAKMIALGVAMLILLTSVVGAKKIAASQNVPATTAGISLIIPIYNDHGLSIATNQLAKHLKDTDTFLLISGNFNSLDVKWLNKAVKKIKDTYPGANIFIGAGGFGNLKIILEEVNEPYNGLVYIYEPNLPKGEEFNWNFETTKSNFEKAAEAARKKGKKFVGKPSGRPILQGSMQKWKWDYSTLSETTDQLFIQTQTYGKKGTDEFEKAIDKVSAQYKAKGKSSNWFPQVAIDPNSPNGIDVGQAVKCTQIAAKKGLDGMLVWWSPKSSDKMFDYLKLIGR